MWFLPDRSDEAHRGKQAFSGPGTMRLRWAALGDSTPGRAPSSGSAAPSNTIPFEMLILGLDTYGRAVCLMESLAKDRVGSCIPHSRGERT